MRYRLIGPGSAKPVAIRIFAVVAFAFTLLLQTAATVKAQPVCMAHDEFRVELHRNFSEAPVAIAIASNGALIELYAKRDQSSWTLVMTRPGGLSCVLVAGEEWNDLQKREEERIAQLDSRGLAGKVSMFLLECMEAAICDYKQQPPHA